MKRLSAFAMIVGGLAFTGAIYAQTAGQDMKNAGNDTKAAAKNSGRAVKKGTKKSVHAVRHGTHKAASKVEQSTR